MSKFFEDISDCERFNIWLDKIGKKINEYGKLDLSNSFVNNSLPPHIQSVTNIKHLFLRDNKLIEFPDCIINMIQLKTLSLSFNNIKIIPDSIGGSTQSNVFPKKTNLINLEYLFLYNNELSSLPDSINNLTNLKFLDIRNNKFLKKPIINIPNIKLLI